MHNTLDPGANWNKIMYILKLSPSSISKALIQWSSLIQTPIIQTPANLNSKSDYSIRVFYEQVYVLLEYLN